jgi:hypothetical protein
MNKGGEIFFLAPGSITGLDMSNQQIMSECDAYVKDIICSSFPAGTIHRTPKTASQNLSVATVLTWTMMLPCRNSFLGKS